MKENTLTAVLIILATSFCIGLGENNFWNPFAMFFNNSEKKSIEEDSDFSKLKSINQYWLYTRENPFNGEQIIIYNRNNIQFSKLNIMRATVVVVHGWRGYYTDELNTNITAALLQNSDVNVFCVDWSAYSYLGYFSSTNSIPKVGVDLGDFINWLASLGITYDSIHIVGHSLGAHVAGFAGRQTGGMIGRITGLDPAGPSWTNRKGLSQNDAQYVEVIHTCAKILGIDKPCGHADFYPNGGSLMPGCGFDVICAHFRAFFYFSATVMYPEKFVGKKCHSVEDAMNCNCNGETALMGNNDLDKNISGIYCLKTTNEKFPYFK